MDMNTRMQYRYAQEGRRQALANMSEEDRTAWLHSATATLRLGRTNREASNLMNMVMDNSLDISEMLRLKMATTAILIWKQNANR